MGLHTPPLSFDRLSVSPNMDTPLLTPPTAYLFPPVGIMKPPQVHESDHNTSRLDSFLIRSELLEHEVREGLEEFVWRGLVDGRRIRDMCDEARIVAERVSFDSELCFPHRNELIGLCKDAVNEYDQGNPIHITTLHDVTVH